MKEQKKMDSKIQKLDSEDLSIINGGLILPCGGDFGWDLTSQVNPWIISYPINPYVNNGLDDGSIFNIGTTLAW